MELVRPEARFYKWRALTREQRKIALEVVNWLAAYCSIEVRSESVGRTIFEWQRVDDDRASNVIVIDGQRGAGKTSLMFTLVELWRRALAKEGLSDVIQTWHEANATQSYRSDQADLVCVAPLTQPNESNAADEIEQARSAVLQLRGKVIPMPPLDLAPLPHSTSLIIWIAARLREFIDLLDARSTDSPGNVSRRPVVAWEPSWEYELPSRKAWNDLVASAAWGWDDNIDARKGALDPDAYAEELQQSERARVGIVAQWRTLIRAIVSDASERNRDRIEKDARIVIPIDDVDMNPERTGELLEFVRTFWDPQLVFVLSGDSNLILAALQQYADARKRSGRGGASLLPSSREVAAQTYDKVVPLAQRFQIRPPEPGERIALLQGPLSKISGFPPGNQSQASRPGSLKDLLEQDPWAADALPDTLREIHDVHQELLAGQNSAAPQTVSGVVEKLWSAALAHEALDDTARKQLVGRVELSKEGMPSVEGEVDVFAERLGELRVPRSERTTPNERRGPRTRLVLEAPAALVPARFPASPRLRGLYLLAADLAALDADAAWSAISIAASGYRFPAVRARIIASVTANDRVVRKRAEALLGRGLRWSIPHSRAPIDLSRFDRLWRDSLAPTLLKDRSSGNKDRGTARAFLDLVRYVFHDWATVASEPPTVNYEEAALGTVLGQLIKEWSPTDPSPRDLAYAEWARARAPLLAAPESGLRAEVAQQILDQVFAAPDHAAAEIRQARFERAEVSLEALGRDALQLGDKELQPADVNDVLAAIDAAFPGHPWVTRFGAVVPQPVGGALAPAPAPGAPPGADPASASGPQ